jgi:excisionase family DNA binding protein
MAERPLSIGQAAERLGVSPSSLRRWTEEGRIRARRLPGGARRYDLAEVERFAETLADVAHERATDAATEAQQDAWAEPAQIAAEEARLQADALARDEAMLQARFDAQAMPLRGAAAEARYEKVYREHYARVFGAAFAEHYERLLAEAEPDIEADTEQVYTTVYQEERHPRTDGEPR